MSRKLKQFFFSAAIRKSLAKTEPGGGCQWRDCGLMIVNPTQVLMDSKRLRFQVGGGFLCVVGRSSGFFELNKQIWRC